MTKGRRIVCGDRVRLATKFLRDTGQFTGPEAPASWGPFARGQVTRVDRLNERLDVIEVMWDDGQLRRCVSCTLERADAPVL